MPPRSTTTSSDHPSADADAAVRAAASQSRERLAALVAAARRVLAALAADPSAVETGTRVGTGGTDDADAMDVETKTSTSTDNKPHLVLALSDAVEDLVASRSALRESINDLKVAEELAISLKGKSSGEAKRRSVEAASLEPAVSALRDRVRKKNSAVAAMSDSLAALVSDVDSWRVEGPGSWPGTTGAPEE